MPSWHTPESDRHDVDLSRRAMDGVTMQVVGDRAVCFTRVARGYGALDNRCPHQGGPLGEGQIERGYVICPWHGYEYDPITGMPPEGYGDVATAYPIEEHNGTVTVELPRMVQQQSLMDQMVDVMTQWA